MKYYLLKDKQKSTDTHPIFYITNYLESRNGKILVDGHGYCDVELMFSSNVKNDCIAYAQKIFEPK